LQNYSSLPANSQENSHYEYAYSHQETDATGYLNPSVLNTDDAKYETIKDIDVAISNMNVSDNLDSTYYLDLNT